MSNLSDFIKNLEEIIVFLTELTALETEKLGAVTSKNIQLLEECMKKEQAQILRLRGLENKRIKILTDLGFINSNLGNLGLRLGVSSSTPKDITLTDIINKYPDDEVLKETAERLKSTQSEFEKINATVKKAIEINVYTIKKQMESSKDSSQLTDGTVFRNNSI